MVRRYAFEIVPKEHLKIISTIIPRQRDRDSLDQTVLEKSFLDKEFLFI